MSATLVFYLVLLFFFVVLYAFFNSAETAYVSLERYRLQNMLDSKTKGAGRVAKLLEKPERLLSTVLTGQNLMSTAATSLGTLMAVTLWGEEKGALFATLIMTFILLIFGESSPKTFAVRNREKLALLFAVPMQFLAWVFRPLVILLSWISNIFSKMFGSTDEHTAFVRPEDIESMITVGHNEGTVEKKEAEMLHNVFDFGDRPVREVLVPRPEVVSVPKGSNLSAFLNIYSEMPKSRYPVYEESMDNVIGVLSIKDVLMAIARDSISRDSMIDDLVRPAYFAPETKRISDLFHEMRDKNFHMSIIIDEYGGTAGIVSLSRLMEEIFGPVGDDLSAAEKEFESINENTFQIDGSMRIAEANAEIGLNLPEGDYETVAGFVLHLMGRIPKRGQQIKYHKLKIVITKMKGHKIEEVLITREKETADEPAKDKI